MKSPKHQNLHLREKKNADIKDEIDIIVGFVLQTPPGTNSTIQSSSPTLKLTSEFHFWISAPNTHFCLVFRTPKPHKRRPRLRISELVFRKFMLVFQ